MSGHIQITFPAIQPEQQDVLIAHLSEAGYEGFEQDDLDLKAYIPEKSFDKKLLEEMAFKYQVSFTETKISEQNWNAVWESGFQPVIIDDFVAIRAGFHEPVKNTEHEIIITPKMSFGTGHHATTEMMIRQMRDMGFRNKTVFDFGTGTGVLAILAQKMGAKTVVAADNDDWSITNALENILYNKCDRIQLVKTDTGELSGHFDIILANINKNVIIENLVSLIGQLNAKGILLLSGLLEEDEEDIMSEISKYPLLSCKKTISKGWLALRINY